jgi:hypothetical protein
MIDARNTIIEQCAAAVDSLLREDEATAQQASVSAGVAMAARRAAYQRAAEAIRALNGTTSK